MVLRVRTIRAKQFAVTDNVIDLVARNIGPNGAAGELVRVMADYPPQLPTKRPYKRKGSGGLGGGWRMTRFVRDSHGLFSEVENRVSYAGRVQGRKKGRKGPGVQTREMKRRNWLSIDDGVRRVWPKYRRNIMRILNQSDPKVRARRRRMR